MLDRRTHIFGRDVRAGDRDGATAWQCAEEERKDLVAAGAGEPGEAEHLAGLGAEVDSADRASLEAAYLEEGLGLGSGRLLVCRRSRLSELQRSHPLHPFLDRLD